MNIQLFIEGREVELRDDVQFPLTKVFDDLTNPTKIIADFSKTIAIPITKANSLIFGSIYKLDRGLVGGGALNIGVFFDPTRKFLFKLVYNSDVIMEGYGKMNNVEGAYNVTIYGKIGEVFQEMQKLSYNAAYFETEAERDKYFLRNPLTYNLTMDRNLIKASFDATTPQLAMYDANGNIICDDTDIIGYCITNKGYNSNFNSQQYEYLDDEEVKLKSYIKQIEEAYPSLTNVDAVLANGLLDREVGEYRSYYQKPYVYFNKIVQQVIEQMKTLTDYTIELDSDFFKESNPYWSRLLYMLNPLDTSKVTTSSGVYLTDDAFGGNYTFVSNNAVILNGGLPMVYNSGADNIIKNGLFDLLGTGHLSYETKVNGSLQFLVACDGDAFGDTSALIFEFRRLKTNGTEYDKYVVGVSHPNLSIGQKQEIANSYGGAIDVFVEARIADGYIKNYNSYLVIPFVDMMWLYLFEPFTWELQVKGIEGDLVQSPIFGIPELYDFSLIYLGDATDTFTIETSKNVRSGGLVMLNDYMSSEPKPFDIFIRYCKMLGLVIVNDIYARKIKVMTRNKYFADYTIEDWTDKINTERGVTIETVSFEKKYVLFNSDETGNAIDEQYRKAFKVGFGDKRITTDFDFNDETDNLFSGVKPLVTSTENYFDYSYFLFNGIPKTIQYEEVMPSFFKKDGDKKTDLNTSGSFAFRSGNADFPLYMLCRITDDSIYQKTNNLYYYTSIDFLSFTTYPIIDFVYDTETKQYGCLFNMPSKVYANETAIRPNGYRGDAVFIYNGFWKRYIEERYNLNNKKLTAYFDLTPSDFYMFKFSKFVKIENSLFIVNKISDFDMNGKGSTKVELISVTDITAYTNGQVTI